MTSDLKWGGEGVAPLSASLFFLAEKVGECLRPPACFCIAQKC